MEKHHSRSATYPYVFKPISGKSIRSKVVSAIVCFVLICNILPASAQTTVVKDLEKKLSQNMPDTARLTLLSRLCTAYTQVDPVKKYEYGLQYKALALKLNDGKALSDAYVQIGISFGIRSKIDSALYYFNAGYEEARKADFELGMARAMSDIGYAYDRLDNSQESIKYYFRALAIFKKLNYLKGINQCYTNIGSIYFDLQQYKQAVTYFSYCLKTYTEKGDSVGVGYALFTMGNCYNEEKQFTKAKDAFNRSLAIRNKIGDLNGIAMGNKGLGTTYLYQGDYDLAIKHLDTALAYTTRLHDPYESGAVMSTLSKVYIEKKQLDTAEKYATKCLEIGKQIKSFTSIGDALDKFVLIYKARGNYEKAFSYLSQYRTNSDSIKAEKSLNAVTLTEFERIRSENSNLSESNESISTQNASYQSKLNQFGNVMIVVVALLAALIILAIVLFRRSMARKASNKTLTEQKEQIAAINEQLGEVNDELKAQMELVSKQNVELERLNAIKNKFFSIISHDLRSPLSTLQTLFTIYRSGDLEDDDLNVLLVRLEETILSTASFLDNLLEWSKSQLEGLTVNPVDFDVSGLIAENIHLLDTRVELKNLTITNMANGPVWVNADRDMVDLVIRNLLSNSAKFCNPGDQITLDARREGDRAVISIADTGPGISESDREKLFNLEHSLSSGTQGEKGNRLGLVLCKDMLLQNKGDIWYESEAGKGTTFWFDLPAASGPGH